MLRITYGQPEHWQDIKQVIQGIDPHDYVLDEWPHWLEHPESGMTLVALWEDKAVATCHISYLDDETAWFHGMRVDVHYQGRGIAGVCNRFAVEALRSKGFRFARAAIDSDNVNSQKAATRSGFRHVYTYEYLTPARHAPVHPTENCWREVPLTLSNAQEYVDTISPQLTAQNRMLLLCFSLSPTTPQNVLEDMQMGSDNAFWGFQQDNFKAWAGVFLEDPADPTLVMSPVCNDVRQWHIALEAFEHQMAQMQRRFGMWITPDDPLYRLTLDLGYVIEPTSGYQIWERDLTNDSLEHS